MSESGTPEAIVSAEKVTAIRVLIGLNAGLDEAFAPLCASHEALRQSVERLTAERDEWRAKYEECEHWRRHSQAARWNAELIPEWEDFDRE